MAFGRSPRGLGRLVAQPDYRPARPLLNRGCNSRGVAHPLLELQVCLRQCRGQARRHVIPAKIARQHVSRDRPDTAHVSGYFLCTQREGVTHAIHKGVLLKPARDDCKYGRLPAALRRAPRATMLLECMTPTIVCTAYIGLPDPRLRNCRRIVANDVALALLCLQPDPNLPLRPHINPFH